MLHDLAGFLEIGAVLLLLRIEENGRVAENEYRARESSENDSRRLPAPHFDGIKLRRLETLQVRFGIRVQRIVELGVQVAALHRSDKALLEGGASVDAIGERSRRDLLEQ